MIPFAEKGTTRGRRGLEANLVELHGGRVNFEVPGGNLHGAVPLRDILTEILGRGLDRAFEFGIYPRLSRS